MLFEYIVSAPNPVESFTAKPIKTSQDNKISVFLEWSLKVVYEAIIINTTANCGIRQVKIVSFIRRQ